MCFWNKWQWRHSKVILEMKNISISRGSLIVQFITDISMIPRSHNIENMKYFFFQKICKYRIYHRCRSRQNLRSHIYRKYEIALPPENGFCKSFHRKRSRHLLVISETQPWSCQSDLVLYIRVIPLLEGLSSHVQ